jgi:GntR family transcriptional regulator
VKKHIEATEPEAEDGPLARESHVALYRQIARRLEHEIADGRYAPLQRVDPEHALMSRFNVSRITVRQAIDELVRKGLVVRKQGKGTFIAGPSVRHDLHDLRGFFDAFLSQGRRPETRLLSFAPVEPPPEVAAALTLSPGVRPMKFQRLYILDGNPVGLSEAWLTPEASRITWAEVETHSTYAILQKLLGLRIERADMAMRARVAGTAIARLLAVPARASVLLLVRTSFDMAGVPREVTHFTVNSEAYEFTLSAQGPLPISSSLKATRERRSRACPA